jgi:hypothetical protein
MYDGPKMLKPPLIATPGHANRPHEVAYDFFSRENAKDIGFHFIEQQEVQIQPPAGGAHTHGRPHQKVRRCQTLQTKTKTKGLALCSLQPRIARRLDSKHQGRVTAIAKRH